MHVMRTVDRSTRHRSGRRLSHRPGPASSPGRHRPGNRRRPRGPRRSRRGPRRVRAGRRRRHPRDGRVVQTRCGATFSRWSHEHLLRRVRRRAAASGDRRTRRSRHRPFPVGLAAARCAGLRRRGREIDRPIARPGRPSRADAVGHRPRPRGWRRSRRLRADRRGAHRDDVRFARPDGGRCPATDRPRSGRHRL